MEEEDDRRVDCQGKGTAAAGVRCIDTGGEESQCMPMPQRRE